MTQIKIKSNKITLFLILVSLIFLTNHTVVQASEVVSDSMMKSAVQSTKAMMTNQESREKELSKNTKALKHDQDMEANFGSENKEKIYSLSAETLEFLTTNLANDPKSLEELLKQAQSDPQGFYNKLSPDLKSKIQGLSNSIERNPSNLKSP